jgi:polyhydroxyalkanoate synthesis repressor PhaR
LAGVEIVEHSAPIRVKRQGRFAWIEGKAKDVCDENIAAGGLLRVSSSQERDRFVGKFCAPARHGEATRRIMANEKKPTVIKKYANRRLYDTGTSTYVTLEDLAAMVKRGEDFVVCDAKTGEDITRPVLTQIIFEQEGKEGQSLLPIAFLRQLIRFYGDSMQMLVPSYLEFSLDKLTREQQKFRDQFTSALGAAPFGVGEPTRQAFQALEEQARKNMAVFRQALVMFNPFGVPAEGNSASETEADVSKKRTDVDELKRQLDELNKRIDTLSSKTEA